MIINFGRYRGRSTEEIYRDDPCYVDCIIKTPSGNPWFEAVQVEFKRMRDADGWNIDNENRRALPWWDVLEVDPEATLEEIKRAFKRMVRLYHPDKVSDLGVELQALATRKTQEINAAYDKAQHDRGVE